MVFSSVEAEFSVNSTFLHKFIPFFFQEERHLNDRFGRINRNAVGMAPSNFPFGKVLSVLFHWEHPLLVQSHLVLWSSVVRSPWVSRVHGQMVLFTLYCEQLHLTHAHSLLLLSSKGDIFAHAYFLTMCQIVLKDQITKKIVLWFLTI